MRKLMTAAAVLLMTVFVLTGCIKTETQPETQPPETTPASAEPTAETPTPSDDTAAPTDDATPSPDLSPSPSGTAVTEEPPVSGSPDSGFENVAVEPDTYTYNSDYIEVFIETPRLTGLSDTNVQDDINAVFADYAQYAQTDVTSMEDENRQMTEQGYSNGVPYNLEVTYEVKYLKNGLLSLTLIDYRYSGGAHGGATQLAFTFDLTSGNQLSLRGLMSDDSYKSFMNDIIRAEINRRVAAGELGEIATFTDIGNTSQWYLSDTGIVIYFQQYEYFPYAAGIQEFEISYDSLQPFINEQYISRFS